MNFIVLHTWSAVGWDFDGSVRANRYGGKKKFNARECHKLKHCVGHQHFDARKLINAAILSNGPWLIDTWMEDSQFFKKNLSFRRGHCQYYNSLLARFNNLDLDTREISMTSNKMVLHNHHDVRSVFVVRSQTNSCGESWVRLPQYVTIYTTFSESPGYISLIA